MSQVSHIILWVRDQDEALAFYTEKLGMEVRDDVTVPEMGDYRWLTVGPTDQPELAFLLKVPAPPFVDAELVDQVKEVVAAGVAGGIHLSTDDCRATYEELRGRGVEFTQEPTDRPYGVDALFRDPSGHAFRLVETG